MASITGKEFTFPEFFKACGIDNSDITLLSSRNTLVFDKEGDLWIELAASESQKPCENEEKKPLAAGDNDKDSTDFKRLYRFKVCSRAMRGASAYWNAVLFRPWLEGKPSDGSEWVVALEDDQPLPIAVLLAIIHGRPEQIPELNVGAHGAVAAVSGILSTADKYDLVRVLQPFVHNFVPHLDLDDKLDHLEHNEPSEYDYLEVLHTFNIAWHLGTVDCVERMLKDLSARISKKQLDALLGHAQDSPKIGSPLDIWKLLDGFKTYQETAIQTFLDFFHRSVECLANDETERGCMMPMLKGPRAAAVMSGDAPFLKDEAAMDRLLQRSKLQKRQCNALVLGQILGCVYHHGSKTIPKQAKDVETGLEELANYIADAFSLDTYHERQVFLPGHKDCTGTPLKEFARFESMQHPQDCYKPALEPGQLEWLRIRGEVLNTLCYVKKHGFKNRRHVYRA